MNQKSFNFRMSRFGSILQEPKLELYRHYVKQMVDNRAHILSAEQESLLAGAGEIFGASSDTFAVLNNADLEFPTIVGRWEKNPAFSWCLWSIDGKHRSYS